MTATGQPPVRGPRSTPRVDLATAAWERNEYGVDVLVLSADAASGALTLALRTPAGLAWPEREHFYDCDQDLYQFAGEFHHDEELPVQAGDYLWRPAGTIYGHSEGSAGGLIVASLGRKPCRYHLDEHPGEWTGHYRVDRLWNDRPDPYRRRADEGAFAPLGNGGALFRPLRGSPGARAPHGGCSAHSPWAAEAVGILRLPAGYSGQFPAWPGFVAETLVTAGLAEAGGQAWFRGCYAFDGLRGGIRVSDTLDVYLRLFTAPAGG
jgi:hypothetical protein